MVSFPFNRREDGKGCDFVVPQRNEPRQKGVLDVESSMLILHSSDSVQIKQLPRT